MKTLAALLLILFPAALHAQEKVGIEKPEGSWYLLVGAVSRLSGITSAATESIPMKTEEQCEMAGQKIINSKKEPNDLHGMFWKVRYVCIEGK